MGTSFIIVIDSGNPNEQSSITTFLQVKGCAYWHWIDDLWIASGLPATTSAQSLWSELSALPGLAGKTMVVIGCDGPMRYFGRAPTEAWKWLADNGHQVGSSPSPVNLSSASQSTQP